MKEFFKVTDLKQVLALAAEFPLGRSEILPLDQALGRNLAEDIIAPLAEISEKPMNDMIGHMEQASKLEDAAALRGFADSAYVALDNFYKYLETILKAMRREENRRELAHQLKVIIAISEKILSAIRQELEKQGIRVFDSTTKPAEAPGR